MKEPEVIIVTPERTAIEKAISESVVKDPSGTTNGVDHRVLDGARKLDREIPGWADQINMTRFDICDSTECVLGQLYGDYFDGLNVVFGKVRENRPEYSYGFAGDDDGDSAGQGADWRVLQRDWKKVIRERRTKK